MKCYEASATAGKCFNVHAYETLISVIENLFINNIRAKYYYGLIPLFDETSCMYITTPIDISFQYINLHKRNCLIETERLCKINESNEKETKRQNNSATVSIYFDANA